MVDRSLARSMNALTLRPPIPGTTSSRTIPIEPALRPGPADERERLAVRFHRLFARWE